MQNGLASWGEWTATARGKKNDSKENLPFIWERCARTSFVEQQGHVRGKVPMSPSLIGAHHSALFLSHYGRSQNAVLMDTPPWSACPWCAGLTVAHAEARLQIRGKSEDLFVLSKRGGTFKERDQPWLWWSGLERCDRCVLVWLMCSGWADCAGSPTPGERT